MTYKQAYDKIIDAYFKDEIKPLDSMFCFCGTLCNNTYHWHGPNGNHSDSHGYRGFEFVKMENALLSTMRHVFDNSILRSFNSPKYEDALFQGMCAALDVLKEIHRERGEDVDNVPALTKRELKTAQ